VLDGFVLLEACRVEDPDEAEKAVLEGCGISSVISEDLSFFRKLTHLDLGDNRVQLASLAYLPALVELHLDCNGLCECSCPASGFPCLEVLNLSYNGLSTAAIAALADLPRLRQLDLSMNELTALPADMSAFTALQSLNCEHNALGSEASFLALGSIPGLRSLSLAHNRVEALPASPIDAAFSLLTTLDLAHNLIVHEEALLPVLQMGSLRMLLIYGNPFLKLGAASDDFHEVLAVQRGVELMTLPPEPPKPPAKIDLSAMTTVSEPPSRHRPPAAAARRSEPKKPQPPPKKEQPEAAASSFFLTDGGIGDGAGGEGGEQDPDDEDLRQAEAAALDTDLFGASDTLYDESMDIRTAVTALKAALGRPPVHPTSGSAHHLRLTASLEGRRRDKFAVAASRAAMSKGGRRLANGMEGPKQSGSAVDDMTAGLSALQARMGQHAAATSGGGGRRSDDPAGDAYVASLGSMVHAMGDMQVGASRVAPAKQPPFS